MLDIKSLRDDIDHIKIELAKRGYSLDVKNFKLLDSNRKLLQVKVEDLQSQRKKLSEEFGKLKSSGDDTAILKNHIDEINNDLKKASHELDKILESINVFLLDIPNIPHISCPVGEDETANVVIKKYGSVNSDRKVDHLSITDEIDTDMATKIAGPRFAVLKGDMGFIGPRPALFNQEDLIAMRKKKGVDKLLPGITGWAQVNGRDDLSIPAKVALDVEYLNHQSFWFDIKILLMTFLKVVKLDGVSH